MDDTQRLAVFITTIAIMLVLLIGFHGFIMIAHHEEILEKLDEILEKLDEKAPDNIPMKYHLMVIQAGPSQAIPPLTLPTDRYISKETAF